MFTGIVEITAKIMEKNKTGLVIERPKKFTDVKLGSSISVAGACLSVVKLTKTTMSFDVVAETRKATRFNTLQKGDRVNLERAMKMGDRFDGHMVQGHVEGTAIVIACVPTPLPPPKGGRGEPPSPDPFLRGRKGSQMKQLITPSPPERGQGERRGARGSFGVSADNLSLPLQYSIRHRP